MRSKNARTVASPWSSIRSRTDSKPDDLRAQVAREQLRHSAVREQRPVEVVVELAPAVELDAREERPLLEDVDGVGRIRVLAADVEPVRRDRGVADQLTL